jgi:hypothetical protein
MMTGIDPRLQAPEGDSYGLAENLVQQLAKERGVPGLTFPKETLCTSPPQLICNVYPVPGIVRVDMFDFICLVLDGCDAILLGCCCTDAPVSQCNKSAGNRPNGFNCCQFSLLHFLRWILFVKRVVALAGMAVRAPFKEHGCIGGATQITRLVGLKWFGQVPP